MTPRLRQCATCGRRAADDWYWYCHACGMRHHEEPPLPKCGHRGDDTDWYWYCAACHTRVMQQRKQPVEMNDPTNLPTNLLIWAVLIGWLYLSFTHRGVFTVGVVIIDVATLVVVWLKTRHWTKADYRTFWHGAYGPLPGAHKHRRRR
jgi:hypothetical protein